MKLSTSTQDLQAQLQTTTRVASTRSAIQALSGVQLIVKDGGRRAPCDGHGGRPQGPAGGHGRPRRRRRPARAADGRRGAPAAGRRRDARAPPRRAGRRGGRRHREVPHPHAAGRGLPAAARARRRSGGHHAGRRLRGDHRQGPPLGVAGRDAPDPHRHPRLGIRLGAADGRHRLVSPEREGDAARPADRRRLRGQRAGAGPAGARPRSSRTPTRSRSASACTPTRSCSRSATPCSRRG